MKPNRILFIFLAVFLLLLVPFIAMQFTTKVNWNPSDFLIMAVILFVLGVACELVLRRYKTFKSRVILCGTLLLGFFLIWAELAVGIFGSPFGGELGLKIIS